ncbi:HAD-IA family hydrolase [Iamia sp.]|uniref:HAD family hydrolase n=1 Tax=Iamia sp. TaxID=2722710 RepID=UPI002BE8A888|nr:HAD-IA family hydrolase [Iamia sp.]HXH58245.1 HAD-IA family hydrolase [Iamia sp.]
MSERRFDAVVFDLSGVVITSAFDAIAELVTGAESREVALALLLGPYDEDTDHMWHRVERGEAPIVEWVTWVSAQAEGAGLTIDWAAFGTMMGRLAVHDAVIERVRALRVEGYRTALCTNNVREGSDAWRDRIPVDDLFDAVVDSSAVGMRKPDPRIYLHTLDLLGVADPARAVFLDDHPGNVAGAERAGLAGIVVADPAEALVALDLLLAS